MVYVFVCARARSCCCLDMNVPGEHARTHSHNIPMTVTPGPRRRGLHLHHGAVLRRAHHEHAALAVDDPPLADNLDLGPSRKVNGRDQAKKVSSLNATRIRRGTQPLNCKAKLLVYCSATSCPKYTASKGTHRAGRHNSNDVSTLQPSSGQWGSFRAWSPPTSCSVLPLRRSI